VEPFEESPITAMTTIAAAAMAAINTTGLSFFLVGAGAYGFASKKVA
jgi:hypothetical protein